MAWDPPLAEMQVAEQSMGVAVLLDGWLCCCLPFLTLLAFALWRRNQFWGFLFRDPLRLLRCENPEVLTNPAEDDPAFISETPRDGSKDAEYQAQCDRSSTASGSPSYDWAADGRKAGAWRSTSTIKTAR